MNENELSTMISEAKVIEGDINWLTDERDSPSVKCRANIISQNNFPIEICGTYNRAIQALSYTVIYKGVGRIYGLDLGKDHRNSDTGQLVGEKHKHTWTDAYKDKIAYVPDDITEPASNPIAVWQQFCTEFNVSHNGRMNDPPPLQGIILL